MKNTATTKATNKGNEGTAIDPETGIDVAKVKAKIVDEYLAKLGLSAEGSIGDRMKRLALHIRENLKAEFDSTCTVCKGRSDERLLCCPFCGDTDVAPDLKGKGDEAKAIKDLRVMKANGSNGVVQTSSGERRRRRIETATTNETSEKGIEQMKTEQAEAKAMIDETIEASDAELVPAGTPLEGATAIVSEEDTTATVDDLDRSVARIHSLAVSINETAWDLGKELSENYRRKLYLQRRREGAPVYSSWSDFVKKEIPVSVQYSYSLMDVASSYPKNEFREYGITKLLSALRLDPEERPKLLADTKNMSAKEVKAKVTEIVGSDVKRDTGREVVGASMNAVGKALSDKRYAEAGDALRAIARTCEGSGFDSALMRAPIATRLGVDDRTLRKYIAELEENGETLRVAPPSKGGAPKKDKASKKTAPKPEKKAAAKAPPPDKSKRTAPPANPLVTVPITLGKTKIPLLARPLKRNAPEKPAKRLADDPFAIETLPNGVIVRYAVIAGRNGQLQLVIDRMRATS
jgi:hypothetical protein